LSSLGQSTLEQRVSPSERRSSYASTELPATQQDDTLQRFPVDDITQPFTVYELHIPMGDSTVLVVHGVVAPEQPNRTPRIHGSLIPPGYYRVSVDRVISAHRGVALDIARGEGEKTLGKVEHGVILWRKRYIIIPPSAAARAPSSPPHS
jgi:hypothetical protein